LPHLAAITIYPIKSLDGVTLDSAAILKSGALQHDREWAMFDKSGCFVNGKRCAKVHLLRSSFDLTAGTVSLQAYDGAPTHTFDLSEERTALESWLSDYFGFQVELRQNAIAGFPDDTKASGPTIVSTATLETVASWFRGIELDEIRRRFRTNLEITGVPPFWEDRLFGETNTQAIDFQVGAVRFTGINPCKRCVVPTRGSLNGAVYKEFQKKFVQQRRATLPDWTHLSRFDSFYRLAVNTCIPESEDGKILQTGDEVKLLTEL
jgi:uncharacterized protein